MLVASLRKLCKNSCRIVRRSKRGWLQALFLSLFVSKAVCVAVEFSGEHMRQGARGPNRERDADCTIVNGFRVELRDKRHFATAEKFLQES